jgi:hypothetical protein
LYKEGSENSLLDVIQDMGSLLKTSAEDTLKQLRPIGKGEQVLEKRLDQKELT